MSMDLYTEDAVFFEPDGASIKGKPAIRKLFATVMQTFNSDIHFESEALAFSGTLAYDSGHYREKLATAANGAVTNAEGCYLMVLRRDPDGKWRIVQNMWTLVTPPAQKLFRSAKGTDACRETVKEVLESLRDTPDTMPVLRGFL